MLDRMEFQVHANCNQSGRDSALRVTVTCYGPDGSEEGFKTFRGHTVLPYVEDLSHAALIAIGSMYAMVARAVRDGEPLDDEPDIPLPFREF